MCIKTIYRPLTTRYCGMHTKE